MSSPPRYPSGHHSRGLVSAYSLGCLCGDSGHIRSVAMSPASLPPSSFRQTLFNSASWPGSVTPDFLSIRRHPHQRREVTVSDATKVRLASRSGNRCALPACGTTLTQRLESGEWVAVGKAAHIAGRRPRSARYDPAMTTQERNSLDNLIYVCSNCHDTIDQAKSTYTTDLLIELKQQHEEKVSSAMTNAAHLIAFPELDVATDFVSASPLPADPALDFRLLPPEDKIRLNRLGDRSRKLITTGLATAKLVRSFLDTRTKTDSDFVRRLTGPFSGEYHRLRALGFAGDDLFESMCAFATRGRPEPTAHMAAVAVLVYLFESCEVFEKQ